MAQAKVPKFIDVQDKVIDGLTLWQAIDLGAAALAAIVAFMLLPKPLHLFVAFFAVVAGAAFAFIKVNERPFSAYFMSAVKFIAYPKRYAWHKEPPRVKIKEHKVARLSSRPRQEVTSQKLRELAQMLDIEEHVRK